MFANLGPALVLLRELRGKSQARVAREALIGKSQLSKYETGKELPKLDSLERVLTALGIEHFQLFSTLDLVDRRAVTLFPEQGGPRPAASTLLPEATTVAFHRVMNELLNLHRQVVLGPAAGGDPTRRMKEEPQGETA
jgi:transcriptional regulator with XRE-family HTH domain